MTPEPTSPWRLGDVMSLGASLVIGVAAILVGWLGVSGEAATARQTGWLNVGIGGVVITGIGTAVWLMTGRRAVGERRRRLLPDAVASASPSDRPAPLQPDVPETLVVIGGMTRYHRSTCELVAGKAVTPVPRRRPRTGSLTPCDMCRPGPIGTA